jgi:hypothetical protein
VVTLYSTIIFDDPTYMKDKNIAQQPYRTYHYQLTSKDMLAWRSLRNDWSFGEKLFGLALIVASGSTLALLPEAWVGTPYNTRFLLALCLNFTLVYGLFRLIIALNDRRLAHRDIPHPRQFILEDWVDHLDERWDGGRRSIALEMIGKVLETPAHVYVQTHGPVMIIPATAFESSADKYAFASNLEEMSKEAPSWSRT